MPFEEAAAAIARFADAQPADKRDRALELLFAGLLSTVNNDRAVVMSGIERFQQRQKARAAEIERQGAMLRQLKDHAESDEKTRSELLPHRKDMIGTCVYLLSASSLFRSPARCPCSLSSAYSSSAAKSLANE